MSAVGTIIKKEWMDVRKNKLVLYVVLFVPLLMTAIPLVMMGIMGRVGVSQGDLEEMATMLKNPLFQGLNAVEAVQSTMASNFLVLFLMMPLMVPVTIASYSIVGEKVTRSLEPLLATPVSTMKLLLAKGVAAAVPGIVGAWLAYLVFLIGARFLAVSDRVYDIFLNPMWLVAMLVLAPLLTIMAVNVGIIVSSRTSDPRAAEQLGSLIILPLMVLFIGPLAGFIQLNVTTFLIAALIALLADVVLMYLGVKLFQRETVLTRWK
jgi:ABC-2 type transport system permease protein